MPPQQFTSCVYVIIVEIPLNVNMFELPFMCQAIVSSAIVLSACIQQYCVYAAFDIYLLHSLLMPPHKFMANDPHAPQKQFVRQQARLRHMPQTPYTCATRRGSRNTT